MANRKVVVTSIILTAALAATLGVTTLTTSKVEYDGNLTESFSSGIENVSKEISKDASDIKTQISKTEKTPKITKEEADEVVKEYFTDLKNEIIPVWEAFKESGKSGFNELKELVQSGLVKSYDFTHGKMDINGVYFTDLTDSGKAIVHGFTSFLNVIATMIDPNYKEWFADRGDDFKNFIKEENVEALKTIKDGALTLGGNFIDFLDNKWEEEANEYRKGR